MWYRIDTQLCDELMNEQSFLSPVRSVHTVLLLPSLPLKSVTKVCILLQSQPLFRAEQCVCIIISHKDCSAGTILTGLCDIRPGHPPTCSSFGSQSATPLLKSGHAPWRCSHAQKLTLSQRQHTGLYFHVAIYPESPPLICLAVAFQ